MGISWWGLPKPVEASWSFWFRPSYFFFFALPILAWSLSNNVGFFFLSFFGWVHSAFGWGRSTCGWDPSTLGSGRCSPTIGWGRSTFGWDCYNCTFGWPVLLLAGAVLLLAGAVLLFAGAVSPRPPHRRPDQFDQLRQTHALVPSYSAWTHHPEDNDRARGSDGSPGGPRPFTRRPSASSARDQCKHPPARQRTEVELHAVTRKSQSHQGDLSRKGPVAVRARPRRPTRPPKRAWNTSPSLTPEAVSAIVGHTSDRGRQGLKTLRTSV